MSNSHSSSGHICFESQKDDLLDSINYKSFEPPDEQSVEWQIALMNTSIPLSCLKL